MTKTAGGGKLGSSHGKSGKLLKGMKRMAPASSDSSSDNRGGSMDSGACRKEVASTPKTLGPRRA